MPTFQDIFDEYGIEEQFQQEFRKAVLAPLRPDEISEKFRQYLQDNGAVRRALVIAFKIQMKHLENLLNNLEG